MSKEFFKNVKMRLVKESLKKGYSVEEDGELWGMILMAGISASSKKDKKNLSRNSSMPIS